MPNIANDYTNKKINELLVIRRNGYINYAKRRWVGWLCKCDCGNEITLPSVLLIGNKFNCGCRQKNKLPRKKYKCLECGKYFYQDKVDHEYKFCSHECYSKNRIGRFNEENSSTWKGNDVGYSGVHAWIKNKFGFPNKCEICGTTTAKIYHWANINHRYKRKAEDWKRMCVSCHAKYDYKFNNKKHYKKYE